MTEQLSVAKLRAVRLVTRFVVLLVVLSVLIDLIGWTAVCFDPARPFATLPVPFCLLLGAYLLTEGLEAGGLAGLLWHYLPAIVVSLSIAIAWTLKDFRRKAT